MYSPLQARGPDGKWIAKGTNAAFHAAQKGVRGKRSSGRVSHGASRGSRNSGFVPYVRVNKRSQTAGFNQGRKIPGTHKRLVVGSYARIESTQRQTGVDRFAAKHAKTVFPEGSRRGKAVRSLKKNFSVNNPALRGSVKGHEVRLGTSRGAGPTVIVRRGKHKTAQKKSQAGVQRYDTRMRAISGTKASTKAKKYKPRPQRRRAARKKR